VMDFVEGRNLREFYRGRRRFDSLEAAGNHGWCDGWPELRAAAGNHTPRLKMSNVLVSSEGVPQLVDFGLAGMQGPEPKKPRGHEPSDG